MINEIISKEQFIIWKTKAFKQDPCKCDGQTIEM